MTGLFEHPERLLLALAIVPALAVFALRFRKLRTTLLPLVSRMDDVAFRPLSAILRYRSLFFASAWILLACAAANPRWGTELVTTRQEGSSVMFVIDVSRSMTVSDIAPSRLSFASGYASKLVEALDNARCGVVLAKGDAVLAIPLTADHRSVSDLLDTLSPAMVSFSGSNPGRGVRVALESFPETSAASRTVILLTDGDETGGSLDEAAKAARAAGVKLAIIGVGTKTGKPLNVKPVAEESEMMTMVLRDDILRRAARMAGRGSLYVTGTEAGSAKEVLAAIVPASVKEQKLVYSSKPVYRYPLFLFAALLFFCAGLVTGGVAWRKD